jgi:hypothetical protein
VGVGVGGGGGTVPLWLT